MAEGVPQEDFSKYLDTPLLQKPAKPLEGRSALITGATEFNGIGFAMAERFALEGASPVIITGTENSRLRAPYLVERLKLYGVDAYAILGDLRSEQTCVNIMEQAYEYADDDVSILVNNAGVNKDKPFTEVTKEDLDFTLGLKAGGALFMAREWFKIRDELTIRGGRIINVSSIVGLYGNFGQETYAMANGALNALTKCLALDFGRRGITVNAIAPAFVMGTNMTRNIPEQQIDLNKTLTPLKDVKTRGGIVLTPQDIAGAAFYFAGPDGDHITGQILVVDGNFGTNHTAGQSLYLDGYRKVPRAALGIVESLTKEDIAAVLTDREERVQGGKDG